MAIECVVKMQVVWLSRLRGYPVRTSFYLYTFVVAVPILAMHNPISSQTPSPTCARLFPSILTSASFPVLAASGGGSVDSEKAGAEEVISKIQVVLKGRAWRWLRRLARAGVRARAQWRRFWRVRRCGAWSGWRGLYDKNKHTEDSSLKKSVSTIGRNDDREGGLCGEGYRPEIERRTTRTS